jgi:UbiD family decarboxylase
MATIDVPVSTRFDVAALEKALDGKKAVFVRKPSEGRFPIVANLLTSHAKFAEALRTDVASFEAFFLSSVSRASKPALVDQGAFHHAEKTARLRDLPIVQHFEKDSGPSAVVAVKGDITLVSGCALAGLPLADGFQLSQLKAHAGKRAVLDGGKGELVLD